MIIDFKAIFDDIEEQGGEQIVVFTRTADGNILVHGSHDAEETDNLINDGLEEWENLSEYDEEEEEEDDAG